MDVEMDSFVVESSSEGEIKPSSMLVDPIYLSSDSEDEMCTYTTGSCPDDEDGLSDELQSMLVNIEHALYTGIPTRSTYAEAMVTLLPLHEDSCSRRKHSIATWGVGGLLMKGRITLLNSAEKLSQSVTHQRPQTHQIGERKFSGPMIFPARARKKGCKEIRRLILFLGIWRTSGSRPLRNRYTVTVSSAGGRMGIL